MDALITATLAALVLAAWLTRRDAVPAVLAAAFVLSTVAGQSVTESFVPGVIGLFDGLVVIAMLVIVTRCYASECSWCERGQRARFVGWVGAAKLAMSLPLLPPVQAQWLDWWWYAAMINVGFVVQVAIAGGWLNGLAVFLHRHWHRPRRVAVGHARHREGA